MSFKLQGFGNRESHYQRPSDDWVCGRAAEGTPCELGADPSGRCSLTGETGCRPVRSVTARRAWITRWTLITTVAALALLLTGPRASWFVSPGELSFHHADGVRLEARGGAECGDCHAATAEGIVSFTARTAESRLCLQCHALGEFAMEPHSRELESLGAALSERSGVACVTCHSEHRGRSHDLSELDDVRCQACHTERFESFEADHPELVGYPQGLVTPHLRFDHRSHAFQNFRKERNGIEDREFRCLGCHLPDGSRRHMQLRGYDASCGSCHDQQIADSGDVAIVTLLGLDTMSLEDMEVAIGRWPSEEEPEPSVITELLLRGEEGAGEYLDVLATIDPLDLSAAQNEELAAVRAYAWSAKKLMVDLSERGHEAVADRLAAALGARPPEPKLIRLVGGLPHETVVAAVNAWFPAVERELSLEASGTPPATELVYPEPEADSPEPPGGGWRRDDYEMRLLYRPTGHADALMRAWIELGGTGDTLRPLFDSLTGDFAPGRCAKCHVLEPGSVIWSARRAKPFERHATRFSHAAHLSLFVGEGRCDACHRFTEDGTDEQNSRDFSSMRKERCAACHRQDGAPAGCLTCHNYHVGTFASP